MLRPKAYLFAHRPFVTRSFLALALAAAFCVHLHAQTTPTITILMLDGKTGKPIVPSNFIVRFDHRNEVHNDSVVIDDEGVARALVPPARNTSLSRAPSTIPWKSTSTAMPPWRRM